MIWKADIIAYDECIAFEFACEEGRKNVLDAAEIKVHGLSAHNCACSYGKTDGSGSVIMTDWYIAKIQLRL